MASSNMDAGNFKNLNWTVGPQNRFKAPAPDLSKAEDTRNLDKGPRDQFDFGSLNLTPAAPDVLEKVENNDLGLIAGAPSMGRAEQVFSPSGLLDLNTIGSVNTQNFSLGSDITALNTLSSTSLLTVSGANIASLNPLNPAQGVRMKTTSVATNGIEDTSWVTSSGRVVSADSRPEVRMPTTSVTTFGLEDSEWLTTSGRRIAI